MLVNSGFGGWVLYDLTFLRSPLGEVEDLGQVVLLGNAFENTPDAAERNAVPTELVRGLSVAGTTMRKTNAPRLGPLGVPRIQIEEAMP